MKVKWYKSVRLRMTLLLAAVYVLSVVLQMYVLYGIWGTRWREQEIDEILRYGNYVADNIAMDEVVNDKALSQTLPETEEARNFSRFYSYVRIMVLDQNARVVEDSARTMVDACIVNEDILNALSGTAVEQRVEETGQIRMAIPLYDYSKTSIRGAIYILFSVDSLGVALEEDLEVAFVVSALIAVVVTSLIFLIGFLYTEKFQKIFNWLERVTQNSALEPESKLKEKDEFGAIVVGVQQAMGDLVAIDQSRKEFVSNVSHELKTPLSSIKVLAESLLLQENLPPEIYREFLEDINNEIDRETGIVNDLLTLVRLEESENVLNITRISLNDLLEGILKRLRPLAEKKSVELLINHVREVEIEADETKLIMAFSNLIENGIKYNKENGRVTVTIDADLSEIKVFVEDTGIGIEEEDYTKIFQRFYRVDKSRVRDTKFGGTGLGLSIVRQIVMLHKGRIGVKSIVNEGTIFVVSFPVHQISE